MCQLTWIFIWKWTANEWVSGSDDEREPFLKDLLLMFHQSSQAWYQIWPWVVPGVVYLDQCALFYLNEMMRSSPVLLEIFFFWPWPCPLLPPIRPFLFCGSLPRMVIQMSDNQCSSLSWPSFSGGDNWTTGWVWCPLSCFHQAVLWWQASTRYALPFSVPSCCAKWSTPNPNVSYLYLDLTQLQLYVCTFVHPCPILVSAVLPLFLSSCCKVSGGSKGWELKVGFLFWCFLVALIYLEFSTPLKKKRGVCWA